MDYRKIHRGCGGVVKERKCSKCGKTWGKIGYLFSSDVITEEVRFNGKAYRKRIREKRDIYK